MVSLFGTVCVSQGLFSNRCSFLNLFTKQPRIDPLKLLTCLSVLLAPNGGIRSANEVKRLAK